MDSASIIRVIQDPTIELDQLSITNNQIGDGKPFDGQKAIEVETVEIPYAQIKGYQFSRQEIIMLEIDTTGFLPTINMIVQMQNTTNFVSSAFPTDGDLVSVFIRARDDLFKPIRNDYLITNVEMISSKHPEGLGARISISGYLHVPRIYDEVSQAINGTSFNVLKEIAYELGLGFATNVDSTNDEMNWVSPNVSTLKFIKDITDHSWRDKDSFFTSYIDVYYNLNFVNVNTQFADESSSETGLSDSVFTNDIGDFKVEKNEINKILTNHPTADNTSSFIKSYKPVNRSSELSKKYGYTYNLQFFEHNSLKNWEFPIQPLMTKGNENKVLLKGRPKEDFYKTQQTYNYIGVQYSAPDHNVHENYYLARAHNMMNLVEIDKLNLNIDLAKFNFNFVRFEKVPVTITITNDEMRRNNKDVEAMDNEESTDIEEQNKIIVDPMYTGIYTIKGFKIKYKRKSKRKESRSSMSALTQEMILARREWPSLTGE